MIYEVFLPFGEFYWDAKTRRRKTTNGLLEAYTSHSDLFGWFDSISPSDTFGQWLIDNCPSWIHFSECREPGRSMTSEIIGAVLGFRDPGDAILVKLIWGGR